MILITRLQSCTLINTDNDAQAYIVGKTPQFATEVSSISGSAQLRITVQVCHQEKYGSVLYILRWNLLHMTYRYYHANASNVMTLIKLMIMIWTTISMPNVNVYYNSIHICSFSISVVMYYYITFYNNVILYRYCIIIGIISITVKQVCTFR